MRTRDVLMTLLALLPLSVGAQEVYAKKEYTAKNGTELLYRELVPERIEEDKKYPLVLFMHGAGERGQDNQLQLTHGSNMFLNPVNREQFPAYVLFPQCPEDVYWTQEQAMPLIPAVKELIDSYIKNEKVDKNRIYIIGLSMGGMATYDIVARYPKIFAAAIPICGAAKEDNILSSKGIDKVKFRIFHGDKDSTVTVDGSRNAYHALKKSGADVKYHEFVGCEHNSWDPAFNVDDFMSWLFSQSR